MGAPIVPICRRTIVLILFSISLFSASAAKAGCGLDIICAVGESAGRGAGAGMADSLRPLVTDVMEREAPALIAQLQAAVDHNILTAEEAGERLVQYAAKLFDKAAEDLLANVQGRGESLIAFAHDQTLDVEQKIFEHVQEIIKALHCETLGVQALIDRQQQVFRDTTDTFLTRLLFWQKREGSRLQRQCRTELGINAALTTSDLYTPTIFRLWRCVRLASVDPKEHPELPATSIRDAYNDVVSNGSAAMCALKTDPGPLRDVTEVWIEDTQSQKAWDRAVHGE